jgi:gliding motility-associated-like protein
MIQRISQLISVVCLLTFFSFKLSAQVVIGTSPASSLVQDVLVGSGVQISNVTSGGDAAQIGTFNSGSSVNLSIGNGVIMTTGNLNTQASPLPANTFLGSPANFGTVTSASGNTVNLTNDPDLNAILSSFGATPATNNIASIEFDFIPSGDSLAFNYVFASEEYNGFVCSQFFDVFGFFISGPGFNGPYTNNAENIAKVPGTNLPVSMNTINNGISDGGIFCPPGGLNNAAYYVDNSASQNFAPYGFTRTLTAQATVVCGATYHIKLILANGFDQSYDSWVFLEAESFTSNIPNFQIANLLPDSSVVEGCTTGQLVFTRDQIDAELIVPITYGGTAISGFDYEPLPDTITFAVGQDSIVISLIPILDEITEGFETVTMTFQLFNDCGELITINQTIKIRDQYELTIVTPDLTLNCPNNNQTLAVQVSGGYPPYNYNWSYNNLITPTINVPIAQSQTFYVEVSDVLDCIFAQYTDSVVVTLNYDSLSVTQYDTINCPEAQITLNAEYNQGLAPYTYNWAGIGTDESIIVNPSDTTAYTLTVTDACNISKTVIINVNVPEYPPLIVTPIDTTICKNGGEAMLRTLVDGGNGVYAYNWTGPGVITLINDSISSVSPTEETDYIVTVSDGCNTITSETLTVSTQSCELKAGNAFSPNGDGKNDFFEVANIQYYPNNTVVLFNRWGKKVFEQTSYMNDWGSDSDVTAGTYYYVVDPGDGSPIMKGYVTVLKD